MTDVERLAAFVAAAQDEGLSAATREALKVRVLDALGCALGAVGAPPMVRLRAAVEGLGGVAAAHLIGGGRTSPDRAALYNGGLVRYLDFNDSFLAPGETCHPSDQLGAVLAAAEAAGATGARLLTALAVSYQVQGRLSEAAPVRARGFDHTTEGAYAAAAAVAKASGLSTAQTAHAIAISGTMQNALRVTRTGRISTWKGLASAFTAAGAVVAARLAAAGIEGPLEVFEGRGGFKDAVTGPFEIDWAAERLDLVERTIVKKYNAEVHSQSAIDAVIELRGRAPGARAKAIEIDTFDVAHRIIGGGAEGPKDDVRTKEQADHSLPYLAAVAWLDGVVGPAQYAPDRIAGPDVQALLRRVTVRPDPELSARFPREMPARVRVTLEDGRRLAAERRDYDGFTTRPASWEATVRKFHELAAPHATAEVREAVVNLVRTIEHHAAGDLAARLKEL